MATANPFDLLGDDDNEDPSQLLAAQQQKLPAAQPKKPQQTQPAQPAKLPSKPLPPAQSVRDGKYEGGRGGGRGSGGGRGFSRGRGGGGGGGGEFNRDPISNENTNGFSGGYRPSEEGDGKASERRGGYGAPRGSFRGGRRGGYKNGEDGEGERPRRVFDRHSGTGRGSDIKREGSGRGNWGTPSDDIALEIEEPGTETEKNFGAEKQSGENEAADANKDSTVNETEEKESEEEKEMTLEEYEKVLEEKRKALLALKTEERKVDVDKDLKAMQLLSNKKENDEIFIKLGSEKDKRKEAAEKEERAKKSVSINQFLKPAEGERYYGGRGRGRGRGPRGGYSGGPGGYSSNVAAPSIEDPGQFPSLGGK
ncbi:unnamed protein product [Malus baccata var. baccata]